MSKLLGKALTGPLRIHLRGDPKDHEGEAMLLVTVDSGGWPHSALLSAWEIYATDDQNVKVATYVGTSTTENLKRNGKATLVTFMGGNAYFIKGSAKTVRERLRSDDANSLFNLEVEAVLEDSMPGVKMTGIGFEGPTNEDHEALHRELSEDPSSGAR